MISQIEAAVGILCRGISNEEKTHLRQKLLSHLREENDQVFLYSFQANTLFPILSEPEVCLFSDADVDTTISQGTIVIIWQSIFIIVLMESYLFIYGSICLIHFCKYRLLSHQPCSSQRQLGLTIPSSGKSFPLFAYFILVKNLLAVLQNITT